MYHTGFRIREAKYSVVRKKIKIKYVNINSTGLRRIIWTNLYEGIYAYTIQDIITFVRKELIRFYEGKNLKDLSIHKRRKELTDELGSYIFKDLVSGEFITPHKRLIDFSFFEQLEMKPETSPLSMELFFLLKELSNWNGESNKRKDNHIYQFPISKINMRVERDRNRQYRSTFHTKSYGTKTLTPSKSVMAASTDPEYSCYLTMRQKNGGYGITTMQHRTNRANVDGSWKKHSKCKKQWAKRIDNPSYEKLSMAIWKRQLEIE